MQYLETEVDPIGNPVKYDRSNEGLEAWLLFCVLVAGKGAAQSKATLLRFMQSSSLSPFALIRYLDTQLPERLKEARTGQYTRLVKAFQQIGNYNAQWLRTCTVEQLEAIHGIGMKTARFFLMSTRENAACAALDTHILKHLRTPEAVPFLAKEGLTVIHIPTATPPRGLYLKLERVFLDMAAAANMTPANYDYKIWFNYYKGN